jgi:hypothetical protein
MIFVPPSLQGFVNRRSVFSTWVDHLPFGFDLVEALRPRVVVELGSQAGMSYFVFCQSVQAHAVQARCFAVDTWAGDEHTGVYDDSVYQDVRAHNEAHYAAFSELLRMRFEEARPRFADESIDLLHIDGFHTYDAVRGDFEAWYPKVSPGGIVLLHDIRARLADFGAWRFWDELCARHVTFTFDHGFGLGVLRKPGGPERTEPLLGLLFSGRPEQDAALRALYVHAARHVDLLRSRAAVDELKERVRQRRLAERSQAGSGS